MNSSPPITSRANRRRAYSFDNPTTPLLDSTDRRRSDRSVQDEVAEKDHRRHAVSVRQCWSIYLVLVSLYVVVVGIVYYGRRPNGFVPALPAMIPGQTHPDTFNPHTALVHLKAITIAPHPFNSRANTDITKKYIQDQFRELQAEALALGRRNVRYDDGQYNSTWSRLYKSRQQREMEGRGETDAPEGEELTQEEQTVAQSDNMVMWVGGVTESREGDDDAPLLVEISVDKENQPALMVSAHFDSVSTSYGATDDGGGVAVALALIRHFIHHPVQHTLIFLLNNAEEDGLLGAYSFMGAPPNSTTQTGSGHPWKKHVRAFVNLEGGGSGGPSLLFRASNYDIVRQYADHAPFPHASVFISDAFGLGLLNSDTDYSVYVQHNLPGLDIAFYRHRAMYHTTTDALPIESLYHMGANVQATITGLCNSPYLDRLHAVQAQDADAKNPAPLSSRTWFSGKSVFYDVIGKVMMLTDLWPALLINGLALGLGLPVLATLSMVCTRRAFRTRQSRQRVQDSQSEQQNPTHPLNTVLDPYSMSLMGYSDDGYASVPSRPSDSSRRSALTAGGVSTDIICPRGSTLFPKMVLVAVMVSMDVGAVIGASKWLWYSNPFVRYSHPWLVILGYGFLLMWINTTMMYLATSLESIIFGAVPVAYASTQWTLAIGLWWWLVVLCVGTGIAAWVRTGALYGTTVLAIFSGTAALLQIVFNRFEYGSNNRMKGCVEWAIVLAIGLVVPVLVILDMLVVVAYMTAQSFIRSDSGISMKLYLIYGTLMIPVVLAGVPALSRARNFKAAAGIQFLLLVSIAWYLSWAEPYSAENPSSLYYTQHYNQTAGTSVVKLRTDAGEGYILKMISDIPLNYTGSRSGCKPAMSADRFMEECEFSPIRQVFEDSDRDQPLHVSWITQPKSTADGWRQGQLQILASESRFCTVHLAQTSVGFETQLWMDSLDAPGSPDKREGTEILNHRAKYMEVSLREWNRTWSVHARVKDPQQRQVNAHTLGKTMPDQEMEQLVPIKVICGYEDWISAQGHATTFNSIRTHIPDWIRMKGNSIHGLFSVGVDMAL